MRSFQLLFLFVFVACSETSQAPKSDALPARKIDMVNVFVGTSGDHGQMSPAASYPFSMLSIGPHTYPSTHTGYEYLAKEFLGFSHTRLEGVGCKGSGGNLLVKPFLQTREDDLIKRKENAHPGFYSVGFANGIEAKFTVNKRYGIHSYHFPQGNKAFFIDLSHATVDRFVEESHQLEGNAISGWIDTRTTCSAGKNRLYFYLTFDKNVTWNEAADHQYEAVLDPSLTEVEIHVGLSSVNEAYAREQVTMKSFDQLLQASEKAWEEELGHLAVQGPQEREELFYSLLYRAIQQPYVVSEDDGYYRALDGEVTQSDKKRYHGWAIWDNYRTQLPLLSLVYPQRYADMVTSIANLYPYGKKDFATETEPSPSVRTEHAIVVLWDAHAKGYQVDFPAIKDSLIAEVERIDRSHPDKALEAAYDAWALSNILKKTRDVALSETYHQRALEYKTVWNEQFADITAKDADRMGARGMYQGTIWQYRWFVPFDHKGLEELTGGEEPFIDQLDAFFDGDYYNHANQPDLQTTSMYQGTSQPWKSQKIIHKIAVDTVVQHYFNNNSRGTGSYVGLIYKNQPAAYLPTMDDDAGTMASWYVWASCGLFPACVGEPVYYLHAPLLQQITWKAGEKPFEIQVSNFDPTHAYVKSAVLNGQPLNRNWLTHQELISGGTLELETSSSPNKDWGTDDTWKTEF